MFRNRILIALFALIWIGLGLGLERASEASSTTKDITVVINPLSAPLAECVWSPSTNYPAPTSLHSSAVLGGVIYSFGGMANAIPTAASYYFEGTTWMPIAPLPEPLYGATAISDGSYIYILGGANQDNVLMNAVYRYEPLGNFYTILPALPTPRALHSAAYLNGKIHVWGGTTDGLGPASNSHVVLDTAILAWTDAAPVPAPASYATSFVHGGYIYSVGGIPDWFASTATATTLRYDPSMNVWSDEAMADLPQPRMNSIGSMEAFQGQLMLVGGNETSALSWDPTSNAWASLPSPSIPHSAGIGGVIGDTLYVSSGTSTERLTCTAGPEPTPEVYVDFGDQPVGLTTYETLMLQNGSETEIIMGTPTFADGSQFSLAADPNGTVVAPGGEVAIVVTFTPTSIGPKTDTVTIQSTAGSGPVIGLTGTGVDPGPSPTPTNGCGWSPAANYPDSTGIYTGAVAGSYLYSFGDSAVPVPAVTSYKFDGTAWTPIAALPEPRWGAAAVSDGTYIYILGGANQGNTIVDTVYRYDPAANSYSSLPAMPFARALHSAAYLNGKIHVWGGTTDGAGPASDSHVVFDTVTLAWSHEAPVAVPAAYATSFVHNGYIYSVGGAADYTNPVPVATTLRYDPAANSWTDAGMADLPQPRMSLIGSTHAFQGQLMVVGGGDSAVLSWDPATNVWTSLPSTLFGYYGGIGGVIDDTFYISSGTTTERYSCTGGPTPTPEIFVDFGDQQVGITSAAQTLVMVNGNDTDIIMGTPTFADGTQFALSSEVYGTVVPPGGEVSIGFTFTPTSAGPKTDTVVIQSTAGSGPVIGLTGNGVGVGPTPTPTVTPTPTPSGNRVISFVGGTAPAGGGQVISSVTIAAQGDENGVGFSLNYDTALLSNPVVATGPGFPDATLFVNTDTAGILGVIYAVPTNTTIPVGTHEILTISFDTVGTSVPNTPVTFGDDPVIREVSNANADTLPAEFADGFITFAQGYEADVAPRPTGSGAVTVADVTQVGRFSAGLDLFNEAYNEFQRADSAPRATLGNGLITVADYTQAGRYAAGLETLATAGGPSGPSALTAEKLELSSIRKTDLLLGLATPVQIVDAQAGAGSQVVVAVTTDAQGIENGIGFTLDYDPAVLQNPVVAKGADAQAASLLPNTRSDGKIGVILAFPAGTAITPGTREIVTVTFNVAANAPAGSTPVTFSDVPAVREISDVDANVVESIFTGGTVTVLAPTSAPVAVAGRVLRTDGIGIGGATLTAMDQDGNVFRTRTNGFGYFVFDSVPSGQSYLITVGHKQFTFAPQIVNVEDNILDLTFRQGP